MDKNTLIIGDLHCPFEHKDYLDFCKRIYKAFKCSRTILIGDLVDLHSCSYHEHCPDGFSPIDEMKEADKHLSKWFKAFPVAYVCKGNHDQLIDRKRKTTGLPERCFLEFRKIWKLPNDWKDAFEWKFEGVLYRHGTGFSGRYSHVQATNEAHGNCVIGHTHSVLGVEYMANSEKIMFGMNVGCGINRKAYAFAYGKDFRRKPVLGVGVVSATKRGVNAQVIPMEMR